MGKRDELKQVIGKIDFFSGLDKKLVDKAAEAALIRSYQKDEAIVRQGEVGLGLYAILKGRVKVEREHQGVSSLLAELGPPQFFAEISMVDSQPRSATVTTLEETECMLLTRDSFLKLVRSYPDLALRLARVLAERLRAADEKLAAADFAAPAPRAFTEGRRRTGRGGRRRNRARAAQPCAGHLRELQQESRAGLHARHL